MIVYLVGLPGAGKSEVGRTVARFLGVPFSDTDEMVEERAGRTVQEIFENEGEDTFRSFESEALVSLEGERVVATGGGSVLSKANRSLMKERGPTVWLKVSPETAAGRVGRGRPLLADEPAGNLRRLAAERAPLYAEADAHIEADRSTDETLLELLLALPPDTAEQQVAGSRVVSGRGALCGLAEQLEGGRVLLALPEGLPKAVSAAIETSLPGAFVHRLPGGESAKEGLEGVSGLWERLGKEGLGREDWLVAAGGGAALDAAAFAASTWHRGVRLALLPTTYLAAADSCIGGKNGVNVGGKNLVGSFYTARLVVRETSFWLTLPPEQVAEGLAEVAKAGLVGSPELLGYLEAHTAELRRGVEPLLREAMALATRVKGSLVEADPTDHGARRKLNLGHTFGHALETLSGYRLSHGKAVGIGLVMACRAARNLGFLREDGLEERVASLLSGLGLPLEPGFPVTATELAGAMARDKKRAGNRPVLVLPTGVGDVEIVNPDDLAKAAEAALGVC